MILGEYECNDDVAYFLKNGKYPPSTTRCTQSTPDYSCYSYEEEQDKYMEYLEDRFFEYHDPARTHRFCKY